MRIDYKILEEVINDIVIYIPKLITACESASELFYQNTMDNEAWPIFQSVVTGYEDLYKALQMTLLDGQEHDMKWSTTLEELLNIIPNQFVMLGEDIKTNSYVAIGDSLRYEWIPFLEGVLKLFKEIR